MVPAIWTTITTFQRIQAAQRLNGQTPINGWLGLVLAIVIIPALYGYMQSGLNSAWKAVPRGGGAGACHRLTLSGRLGADQGEAPPEPGGR